MRGLPRELALDVLRRGMSRDLRLALRLAPGRLSVPEGLRLALGGLAPVSVDFGPPITWTWRATAAMVGALDALVTLSGERRRSMYLMHFLGAGAQRVLARDAAGATDVLFLDETGARWTKVGPGRWRAEDAPPVRRGPAVWLTSAEARAGDARPP
jgi:hypothetical protein